MVINVKGEREKKRERRKLNVSVARCPVALAMHYTPALKK